jgi:hypothetical protein
MTNAVKGFIIANKSLADNDIDLTYNIWKWQMTKLKPPVNIDKISAKVLLKHMKEGTISSPYNISRSRRKCQEMYPETRGEVYAKRHQQQARVKADLRETERTRSD